MRALIRGYVNTVTLGGTSVLVADFDINQNGGVIINPLSYLDQKIATAEILYVSLVGPAAAYYSATIKLAPGQTFIVPPKSNVWVNADTSGHQFSAYFSKEYTVSYPPAQVPGQVGGTIGRPFPVNHPTGLLTVIPSYLYQEYSDDDDMQGFVAAQNDMQQDYVDTFNALNLPIYTGPIVSGLLLDWVATGLYGMSRPSIGTGLPVQVGPLNTWAPNDGVILASSNPTDNLPPINGLLQLSLGNVVVTNDDLYRRILTWHFLKGDGNYFSTEFLKRRVWRFLYGTDGKTPDPLGPVSIADTKQISVSLGVNRNVTIRFVLGDRTVTGGALLNLWGPNGFGISWGANTLAPSNYVDIQLNDVESVYVPLPPLPYMSTFKAALDSGVLETPYQFNFTCTIG